MILVGYLLNENWKSSQGLCFLVFWVRWGGNYVCWLRPSPIWQSSKPTPIATVEKYSLNISATRSWSFMISLFSERAMSFPFLKFLSEKNCEIVFQKFLSCFEHLSSKYLRIEYFRILTTKFLRRLFSSQQDFPYFLNLFLAMFLRYWVFRRTEFIYGTDCDETVLLLTGAWWSTTYLTRELVYHAMSSMLSKISITWNGAYSRSPWKSDSIKFL